MPHATNRTAREACAPRDKRDGEGSLCLVRQTRHQRSSRRGRQLVPNAGSLRAGSACGQRRKVEARGSLWLAQGTRVQEGARGQRRKLECRRSLWVAQEIRGQEELVGSGGSSTASSLCATGSKLDCRRCCQSAPFMGAYCTNRGDPSEDSPYITPGIIFLLLSSHFLPPP